MSLFGLLKRGGKSHASHVIAAPVVRELPAPAEPSTPIVPPRPLPSSAELRQMLFDAIARRDERRLTALCREHRASIIDHADLWMIVPDDLISNPAAAEWYRTGVRMLARLCGDAEPVAA